MTRVEAEIVISMAKNDMCCSAAARELFRHINTVKYHIEKIKHKTGKDPTCFYDLCELLPMAEAVMKEEVSV